MVDHSIAGSTHSPDVAILLDHFGGGGVERVACHVANGLHRRGLSVEMIVVEDDGPVRPLLGPDISVRSVGSASSVRRRDRMKSSVAAFADYLTARSPGLFHAPGNHTILAAWRAVELANYRGAFVPKITNPLTKQTKGLLSRWRRHRDYRRALGRADMVLVLSEDGARQVAALHSKLASKARVIHNPYVSDSMFRRSADRNPATPPVILSMGRLSEQKNQAMLLRAAAPLRDRPWRVRICGTGPEEEALRRLADELGITERLDLAGFVADPVPEYLSATVMALSSRWEGLPATALEAIACGCPVISTASAPGLVELLRSVGARATVGTDDEAGFTQALQDALDGRLPMVRPEAALPYSIEAACDEHARLFAGLIGRRPVEPV